MPACQLRTRTFLYTLCGCDATCLILLERPGLGLKQSAWALKLLVSNCIPSPPKVLLRNITPLWITHDTDDLYVFVSLVFIFLMLMFLGSTADKQSLTTLEELKQEHKKRHHPSSVFQFSSSFASLSVRTNARVLTLINTSRWGLKAVPGSACLVPLLLKTPPLSLRAAWLWISNGAMWRVFLRPHPCPLQQH